ncbi:MAG: quinoprotein amine dehydrogenase [Zunongwangia sp.]|nr:quinoprotein amine dehydrogenase [Zunongwangia sp.]
MKLTKFLVGAFIGSILLSACSDDDDFTGEIDEPLGTYDNGILVLNEGGTGTVTYISEDLQTSEQAIYQAVNSGDDIGAYAQSIFFDDDLAYIISNGSNLITVVNRYTFELVGKVDSGLNVPRYGVVENGKAYVTNQADFSTNEDDYVAVINLQSLEVEQTVVIGNAVEFIEEEDGLLYIQNATYGTGNHISVFNPTTNQVENTFEIYTDPEATNPPDLGSLDSFEIEDGFIYALSADRLEKFNLNTLALESTILLSYEGGSVANLDIEDDQIYFTVGTSVYRMGINAEEAPEEAVLTYNSNSAYGVMYGFEVEDNRIYIADGGDFGSDSFVEVYDLQGNLLNNITVGVGPNGFYFND